MTALRALILFQLAIVATAAEKPVVFSRPKGNVNTPFKLNEPHQLKVPPPDPRKFPSVYANVLSSMTISGSLFGGTSKLPLQTMGIIIEDPSPLLNQVALYLVSKLQSLPHCRQITIYPFGTVPEKGSIRPDIFVRLQSSTKQEDGKTVRVVKVRAGSGFSPVNRTWYGKLAPTHLEWNFVHTMENVHVELLPLKSRPYHRIARKMGNQLGDKLTGYLTKRLEDVPLRPQFPEYFDAIYSGTPDFAFLDDFKTVEQISTRGFLSQNQTIWSLSSKLPSQELFNRISDKLRKQGWKQERPTEHEITIGQYEILNLSNRDKGEFISVKDLEPDEAAWHSIGEEGSHYYVVLYEHVFTLAESEKLQSRLLEDGATASQAIILAQHGDWDHRMMPTLEGFADEMKPHELFFLARRLNPYGKTLDWAFDYFLRGALRLKWEGKDLSDKDFTWTRSRFKEDKIDLQRLPLGLSDKLRKQYGICDIDSVIDKKQTRKINEAFAMQLTPNWLQSWIVLRDESTGRLRLVSRYWNEEFSRSKSLSGISPGYDDENLLRGNGDREPEYFYRLQLAEDGKSYSVTLKVANPKPE